MKKSLRILAICAVACSILTLSACSILSDLRATNTPSYLPTIPTDTTTVPNATVNNDTYQADPEIQDADNHHYDYPTYGDLITPADTPNQTGSSSGTEGPEDIKLPNADDLVDKVVGIMGGEVDEFLMNNYSSYSTYPLYTSKKFSQWFNGLACDANTRVAANTPAVGPSPYAVILIDPSDDLDIDTYAQELFKNANTYWNANCGKPEAIVKYAVKDGLILIVMTSTESVDADMIISAFAPEPDIGVATE